MLQHLYKEAYSHYQLKIAVEQKLSGKPVSIYSIHDISQLISKHAKVYVKGDKSTTTDLRHKQLVNSVSVLVKGKHIPAETKAARIC